jgi:O-antigen/teichoic acid export membrane protein
MLRSEMVKNSFTLISGTVIAQIIPVALQPLLRRIFTPEDFGVFAIYMSLLGMLAAFSSLKYETTLVLPKRDKDANNLLVGSILVVFGFSILFLILIFFLKSFIIDYFNFPPSISKWMFLLPLSAFIFASYQVMNYWLIRKKRFKASAINKVLRRSTEGTAQTGFGFSMVSSGLIIGNLLGDIVNFFSGIYQIRKNSFTLKVVSFRRIFYLLYRYKEFPIYSGLPSFLNTVSLLIPVLIITRFFDEEIAGFYSLSQMVLALPLALVSVSVSQVLLQQISEKIKTSNSIRSTVSILALVLTSLSIPFLLIVLLFGEVLFDLFFGIEWRQSSDITQLLIYAYALKFIVSPLSVVFIALEKVKVSGIWQLTYFIAICSLFLLKFNNVREFFIVYLIIELVMYTIYLLMIHRQIRLYEMQLIKD